MKPIDGRTKVFATLSLAAGLLGATALAVASAAPLGPRAGLEAGGGGLVTQVDDDEGDGGKIGLILEGIGTAIELGANRCEAQVESCEDRYGDDEPRYQGCLRSAGCADDE